MPSRERARASNRANGDDFPGTLLFHDFRYGGAAMDRSEKVRADDKVKELRVQRAGSRLVRLATSSACIGDEDIDAPPRVENLPDRHLDCPSIGYIHLET